MKPTSQLTHQGQHRVGGSLISAIALLTRSHMFVFSGHSTEEARCVVDVFGEMALTRTLVQWACRHLPLSDAAASNTDDDSRRTAQPAALPPFAGMLTSRLQSGRFGLRADEPSPDVAVSRGALSPALLAAPSWPPHSVLLTDAAGVHSLLSGAPRPQTGDRAAQTTTPADNRHAPLTPRFNCLIHTVHSYYACMCYCTGYSRSLYLSLRPKSET